MAENNTWREQRVLVPQNTVQPIHFIDTEPNYVLVINNAGANVYIGVDQLLDVNNFDIIVPPYGKKIYARALGFKEIFAYTEAPGGANIHVTSFYQEFDPTAISQTQEIVGTSAGGLLGVVDVNNILTSLPAGTNTIGQVGIASFGAPLPAGTNNIGDVDIATMPSVTVGSLPALPSGTNVIGSVGIDGMLPAGTNNIGDVDIATMPALNTEGTALELAARTASIDSPDIVNNYGKGVIVFVNITAIVDTPSIIVKIQGKDPVSGNYYDILSSVSLTQTGTTGLRVYPGIAETANQRANDILPKTWRVSVTHADADSITYSVGYSIV